MANTYDSSPNYLANPYAGVLTRRMMAFVIDYAIVLMLMVPFGLLLFFLSILTLGLGFYLFPVLFFIVAGGYFGLTLSSYSQASLGMRAMDLRMVRDDGRPIDFGTAVVHLIAFWLINSVITPFIMLIGLFTDRKRLLHDIALGTSLERASSRSFTSGFA